MVNNMKNIVGTVIGIILGLSVCITLAVFVGYWIIKDKIPTPEENDPVVIIQDTNEETPKKEEKKKKLSHNKLMIVAHPDDDTIFGGAHLIEDDYTVVCVTCGVVDYRLSEFKKAMKYSDDKYKYLSHTDLEPGAIISHWDNEKETINSELKTIIESQDWDLIVAHNPDGEYGHRHHKMVSQMVTDNVKDKTKLYYFGKFKEKGTIDDTPTLKSGLLKKKKEMLAIYKSQPSCTDKGKLTYAFDHENWIAYKDWQ